MKRHKLYLSILVVALLALFSQGLHGENLAANTSTGQTSFDIAYDQSSASVTVIYTATNLSSTTGYRLYGAGGYEEFYGVTSKTVTQVISAVEGTNQQVGADLYAWVAGPSLEHRASASLIIDVYHLYRAAGRYAEFEGGSMKFNGVTQTCPINIDRHAGVGRQR